MNLKQLASIIGGKLTGEDSVFQSLSSDTRQLQVGQTFIALKGERYDGHQFMQSAISHGANAVIIEQGALKDNIAVPYIEVTDTTKALGALAHYWRQQFDIPMVAITGSCGKTTVKTMLGAILSQVGPTLVPQSSFNNQFGLPFTLLQLNSKHQFAVLEIGTNGFGEIANLTKILDPTHSVITNINPAHLSGLKTVDLIAKEKGDIYCYLRQQGTAIINLDEPYAKQWQECLSNQTVLTFGLEQGDVRATDIHLTATGSSFCLQIADQTQQITLAVPGLHNVKNALVACALSHALGISSARMAEGLQSFMGVPGRLRQLKSSSGATIIDDTYNANPASVKAAIDVLSHAPGRKIFVLGDMGELGDNGMKYHEEVGHYARQRGVQQMYAIGELSACAIKAFGHDASIFKDKQSLVQALSSTLDADTTILIKGSRSTKMEEVITGLGGKR